MSRYAASTEVSADRSLGEIERTLRRYGAEEDGFAYARKSDLAYIRFEFHGKQYRIVLPMPDRNSRDFTVTATGRDRSQAQALEGYEQACRQRWRALALVIKAKLEAVESGISTAEDEFLAFRVLPSGRTVAEELGPKLDALKPGDVPEILAIPARCGESQ